MLFALSVNDVYLNVRTYKIYEKDIKLSMTIEVLKTRFS